MHATKRTLLLQSWWSEVLLRHKVQGPHWMQVKHWRLLLSQFNGSDANSPNVTLCTKEHTHQLYYSVATNKQPFNSDH